MELKDRKFINNTGNLPGFTGGKSFSDWTQHQLGGAQTLDQNNDQGYDIDGGQYTDEPIILGKKKNSNTYSNPWGKADTKNYQTAFSAAPGLIGSLYNSWTNYDTKEDLESQYTNVPASVAGVGYTRRILNLKDGKLPGYKSGSVGNVAGATASGAAMGSVAGPWGAAIGGAVGLIGSTIGEIFSSDKQAENERAAMNATNAYNLDQRGIALGKARSIYNAKKYGDPMAQSLYGTYASGKIASSAGPVREEATARVSNGEVIANKFTGNMYRVPGTKNNKDGKLAAISDSDTIVTNKYGLSDYAWRTGDIEGAEEMMKILGKPQYKCGKLPGHAEGWLGNAIPAALGSIASLSQYIEAKNNKPYRPYTYAANPYERDSLSTLAGLSINPYPIMNQLRSAEARTNRAIDIAGGLSGGQRTAARLANLNTTQNNIANLLGNIQTQNNAYKTTYAKAALEAGQQARTARMQANQWDLDMYSKAHAARNKGIQTGIANMLSQIQQYQANEFKRRQFNDTMDLYRADQKQRAEQNAWIRNNNSVGGVQNTGTRGVAPSPMTYDPVNPYTPIAPEPIKRYPWDYQKPEDFWSNLFKNKSWR